MEEIALVPKLAIPLFCEHPANRFALRVHSPSRLALRLRDRLGLARRLRNMSIPTRASVPTLVNLLHKARFLAGSRSLPGIGEGRNSRAKGSSIIAFILAFSFAVSTVSSWNRLRAALFRHLH